MTDRPNARRGPVRVVYIPSDLVPRESIQPIVSEADTYVRDVLRLFTELWVPNCGVMTPTTVTISANNPREKIDCGMSVVGRDRPVWECHATLPPYYPGASPVYLSGFGMDPDDAVWSVLWAFIFRQGISPGAILLAYALENP